MPAGPLKNFKFSQEGSTHTTEANIIYKDGCMYYSCTTRTICRSKYGYFLKPIRKDGFTLNEKGKLSVWFNSTPKKIPYISTVIIKLGNDWFAGGYTVFLTKGLLEKLLTKKITNPLGLLEAWLKAQRIKASPRLLYKAIQEFDCGMIYSLVLKYQKLFEHVDQFLLLIIKQADNGGLSRDFTDLLDQSIIMEKKVDPMWSTKRVELEHAKLTQEIMELQIDSIGNTQIQGLQSLKELADNEYITLLDNERAVFAEGKMMGHCIYTNYWKRIESRSLLCIHVDYMGNRGTLTLRRNEDRNGFNIYDFKDKYNAEPDPYAKNYVKNWLESFNSRIVSENINVEKLHVIQREEMFEGQFLPF